MKITPEVIKKLSDQIPKRKYMTLREYWKLKEIHKGEVFDMACSAYALGFARGSKATRSGEVV